MLQRVKEFSMSFMRFQEGILGVLQRVSMPFQGDRKEFQERSSGVPESFRLFQGRFRAFIPDIT